MTTNLINDGNAVTGDGVPVFYNASYSSPGITDLTLQVYGPAGIGEYNPSGTAFIEYFDPLTGKITVESFRVGGQVGPSLVGIRIGSLREGDSIGQVAVTFVDDANIPGAGPGAKFLGTLGKVLKSLGYVGNSIDGVFGVPGYNVSVFSNNTSPIVFNSTYPPGYLDSLGVTTDNLPQWVSPVHDAQGNLVGLNYESCFLAGTSVDLPHGNSKPIEQIEVGDWVNSYDPSGNFSAGYVVRKFRSTANIVLNVHNLFVTPGHMTLCGDGEFADKHVPIIDILCSDGAFVKADGSLVRAATNQPVGSLEDQFVEVLFAATKEDASSGNLQDGRVRVGTLLFDRDEKSVSVLDCIQADGMDFDPETGLVSREGQAPEPLKFFGPLPRPEDYVLNKSGVTLAQIKADANWEGAVPVSMRAG